MRQAAPAPHPHAPPRPHAPTYLPARCAADPSAPSYVRVGNVAFTGPDFSDPFPATLDACKASCSSTPGCAAVVYDTVAGTCTVKLGLGAPQITFGSETHVAVTGRWAREQGGARIPERQLGGWQSGRLSRAQMNGRIGAARDFRTVQGIRWSLAAIGM